MTSMAIVHADLKMRSELPAGSETIDACGVLADDGLLRCDSGRVNGRVSSALGCEPY